MDKPQIDLAVIIPTLNEEHYIGELLDSIALQTVSPQEVVIVDAFSEDKTIEEIKERKKVLPQLKYYQIPKKTISRQRNLGVKNTTADHLLFLDSDTYLEKDTLEKYYDAVLKKDPGIAVAPNLPRSDDWRDQFLFAIANMGTETARYFYPLAVAINIYIRRDLFEKLGGFDEKIRVGEDCELVQRYAKKGFIYQVLKEPHVYTSVRRLRKEGRIKFVAKMMKSLIDVHRYGYVHNPVEYEFGKYPPHNDV